MLGIGLLGKVAAGAIKGGAKKIATDKLLNRKKKRGSVKQTMQKEGEYEGGGALAVRPSTALIKSPTSAIEKYSGGGQESGGDETLEGTVLRIKTSVIQVESLLGNSVAFQKKQLDDERKAQETAELGKAEADLEKKKPKEPKGKGPKVKLPGSGIFNSIISFISNVLFGYVMVRLVDFLPKLQAILPKIGEFFDGFVDIAGKVFNIFATVVDFGYKLVEMARGLVKGVFGEEGAAKFDIFMTNVKDLIQGFLVWKLVGEKIFKALVSSIRNVFAFAKNIVRRAAIFVKRLIGPAGRKAVKAVVGKIGGAVANVGKNLLTKGTGVASKVVGKVGGFAAKIFGPAAKVIAPALKAATPAVKGFAKRIPILGPLIVGVVSLLSGEPIGQALFKTLGAGLGGALGTFIPIPVIGTLLGETIGMYVGDLLYDLMLGGGPEAAGQRLKEDLGKVFSGGKKVFDWAKDGFNRLMEGMPKNPFKLGGFILNPFNIADKVKLMTKAFFTRDAMNPPKDDEEDKKQDKKKDNKKDATIKKQDNTKKIDDVSKQTEYEESSPEIEFVPIVIKGGTTGGVNQSSSSKLVTAGGGGGSSHDPYEVLDSQG